MKAMLISVIFIISLPFSNKAQNLIAVQNGGIPVFYQQLDSAIIHSQNGDTLYLPGGIFSLSVTVDKRLHIIGVGHNPDSTLATNYTSISGNLSLDIDASNGSLCGIQLNGTLYSGGNISNYKIQRCHINKFQPSSTSTNWSFIENVISNLFFISDPGVSNFFFSNNIIDAGGCNILGYIGFKSSDFRNNIFLHEGLCAWGNCEYPIKANNCSFENNIFIATQMTLAGISNSTMYNNLFVESISFPPNGNYWSSNNIVGQSQSSIFINQSGNSFNYDHDYHLQQSCPGKNAGTDGTDLGIYGGAYPWKTGSVPFNPHIQFKTVSDVYPDGNIHVNIKVAAQDH